MTAKGSKGGATGSSKRQRGKEAKRLAETSFG